MKSSDYWRRREEEAKKHYLNQESTEYKSRINDIYTRQMAAIQKEIDAFYGKYADKEGIRMSTAKKRAAKMDIDAYAAKAEKYVKEKKFTKKANAEMRLYNMTMKVNRLELLKAQIGLEVVSGGDELEKWAAKELQARALDEYRRMSGILGKTVIDNTKMADQIVNASFHNATFSDRIWLHQDLLKHELDAALSTGLIQGRNPRALASEITKIFGAKRSDAERLLRTELTRVQVGALETSLKDNGFDWYEYIAGQAGQCEVCAAMDGKHFEVRKMVIGENAPPMHPNCRCSIAPWEADKKDEVVDNIDAVKAGKPDIKAVDKAKGAFKEVAGSGKAAIKSVAKKGKAVTKKAVNKGKEVAAETISGIIKKIESRYYKVLSEDEFKKAKGKCTADERAIIYGSKNKGYIKSSEAKYINKDLRTETELSSHRQKVTNTLRSVIAKNAIDEDILVYRYVGENAFEDMTGVKKFRVSLNTTAEEYWDWFDSLSDKLVPGRIYPEKAFLSVSAVPGKNVFKDKDRKTMLSLKVPKGTRGYVTTNAGESEIIFDRPKLKILSIETDKARDLKIVHAIIVEG